MKWLYKNKEINEIWVMLKPLVWKKDMERKS